MKKTLLTVLLILSLVLAGCGGSAKTPTQTGPNGQPLDPQGNWIFTFTGTTGNVELQFAGQLFEITSPVVTGNEMGTAPFGFTCGGVTPHGQASGVATINLTVDQTAEPLHPFSLVGTIATDQAHMSGTWTNASNGCTPSSSGTWAAQELVSVNGTWTGTADNGAVLTAVLTENTDQTTTNMGLVTGTLAVTNTTCIAPAVLALATGNTFNLHAGEAIKLTTVNDASGVSVSNIFAPGTVDVTGTHATGLKFTISGGTCDGQQFTADLVKQ
jgi:hypothetical protein